jgi:hypothetical protein
MWPAVPLHPWLHPQLNSNARIQTTHEFSKRYYSSEKDVDMPQEIWKNDSKLEDVVKSYYSRSELMEVTEKRITEGKHSLRSNRLFTLADWATLTKENKDLLLCEIDRSHFNSIETISR